MPEGPEVRKYAEELAALLEGAKIRHVSARTKNAKTWLAEHGAELAGRRIKRIFSHGKSVIAIIEGEYFFYSHQMMWGRWHIFAGDTDVAADRRERARIVVSGGTAVLMSAPIFEVGKGEPYAKLPYLAELGPDVLAQPFDKQEFLVRLSAQPNLSRTIGDALLDQKICAGIGNYLRAEILFVCRIDPWKLVRNLSDIELASIARAISELSRLSYEHSRTIPLEQRERMQRDPSLVYVPGKEYGTRHFVFRRTNLPCLICNQPVRQLRQETRQQPQVDSDDDEKSRIVYFCPNCQGVASDIMKDKPVRVPTQAQKMKRTIMRLLAERGDEKTICPSEVARALDPENWRPLMPAIRAVADDLVRSNKIVVLQKNKPIKSAVASKGPIRLALNTGKFKNTQLLI